MRIAVVTPVMKSGETGGAEALYEGLVRSLRKASYDVDRIEVIIDESTFDAIKESYLTCYDLDLRGYDLVISTKAPTYMVRHQNHVSYLLHTIRVFYDMFHQEFGKGTAEQHKQRRLIYAFDKYGLSSDRVYKHFAIGYTPYKRLYEADPYWQQIAFEVLHPPPSLEGFKEPRPGEYIFLPSRLHRWKRVDLVIKAFKYIKQDIPLKIAGRGEDEATLREAAAGDPRIEFLGPVSDEQLLDLYAGALVVPFVPLHEDYGLITIEAFRSKKPVITCIDSGEPTYFVKNLETGFVVEPDPKAMAEKIDYLIEHPNHAAEMGEKGFSAVSHINWDAIASRILSSIRFPQNGVERGQPVKARTSKILSSAGLSEQRVRKWIKNSVNSRSVKVLITDNQCIEPAVGGGRLRLLGLYSTLTAGIEATYVGAYDWPGPKYRELQLSERLREIDVPLSEEHFALNAHLNQLLPGKTVIDVTIPWLIWSSPGLVEAVRRHAQGADAIIFSHPWMYGCLRDMISGSGKLIIYDSHNCEALLRERLLGRSGFGGCLAKQVKWLEGQLCHESDLILACSEEDKQAFIELYRVKPEKIIVIPNGVDVRAIQPATPTARANAKKKLSIPSFAALFIGSAYPPNIEAAQTIIDTLASANPDVTFLIVGGVGNAVSSGGLAAKGTGNVRLLGAISDQERNLAYAAADIAINPMFTGSGVNIKMLDFFAAGLPTITTPVGARGIMNRNNECFITDEIGRFSSWITRLREDTQLVARLSVNARRLAEDMYNWRDISEQLGELVLGLLGRKGFQADTPCFSVVVPSYERPQSLAKLLQLLNRQIFKDFEVVVVDQSPTPFDLESIRCDFALQYIHTDERGAVKARNTGLQHARGRVIAFTDDDCEPDARWLDNAYKYFSDEGVVGVEGLIESDTNDEVGYRIVTNLRFEGIGFMTANLFLRKEVVDKLGGFDERFDNPHFREDTDLAWRALEYGKIPFARSVKVLHPAHPRDLLRESTEERAKFFVHDPLLFHKHPERYLQLLKAEGHYANMSGFWEYFMGGIKRHKVPAPFDKLERFVSPEQWLMLEEMTNSLFSESSQSVE